MNIKGHDIGVCSWSLQLPEIGDVTQAAKSIGLNHIQLMLLSFVLADDKRKALELGQLRESGIQVTGGMMSFPGEDYSTIAAIRRTGGFRPSDTWDVRRRLINDAGKVAAELGLTTISVHIGFVPPSNEPGYGTMIERVCEVAQPLEAMGIALLMETGQETASELLKFINDLRCRNVGVNFDPANMILYGAGDPIEAIHTLGRHIRHVHVKDATLSSKPGVEWGKEVPFGRGEVPHKQFLEALERVNYTGPLAIEREAGDQRLEDVRTAIETLKSL